EVDAAGVETEREPGIDAARWPGKERKCLDGQVDLGRDVPGVADAIHPPIAAVAPLIAQRQRAHQRGAERGAGTGSGELLPGDEEIDQGVPVVVEVIEPRWREPEVHGVVGLGALKLTGGQRLVRRASTPAAS